MPAAVLTIDINARLAKLEQGITQANRQVFKFADGVKGASKIATDALAAIGVGLTVGAVIGGLRSIRDMALDEQRSIAQLNTVLKATGNAAGLTKNRLDEIGEGVKNSTIFDDDDVRKAETALLRFRAVQGDVFEQAIKLAPDVAAALGTDLVSATQALGKALTHPEAGMRALKDAGIDLSDQQKDLAQRFIETGNKAEAQKIVLDDLGKSIGGTSGADNDGAYGASKRLTRAWDDMLKTLGRRIIGDGAVSDHLTRSVQAATSDIDTLADHWRVALLVLAQQPQAAAGQLAIDRIAAEGIKRRTAAGKITDVDPGAEQALLGKVNSQIRELTDRAYADNKLALKKRADLATTHFAGELATQKNALDTEQANLEFAYSQGLISTKAYFDAQERIAAEGARNLQINLGKQGQAQENILNAKIGDTNQNLFSPEERAAALQRLEAIGASTAQAGFARDQRQLALTNQRTLATRALTDEYASLNAQIAEFEGDSTKAAADTFDRSNRERVDLLRSEAKAAAGSGLTVNVGNASRALAQYDILRQQTIAQAALNDITRDYGRLIDSVGVKQDQVDVDQQRGALTTLAALSQRADLASQYIPLLELQIAKYREISQNEDLPAVLRADALQNVQKMTLEVARLSLQTEALSNKFRDIFESGATQFLDDVVTSSKSAKDAFRDLERSIVSSISHIASQNLAEAVFGKAGALGGGGFDLGGFFAKLFGGGAAPSVAAPVDYGAFLAEGTDNWRGGVATVGERGREKVYLPKGSRVISNDQVRSSEARQSSSGDKVVHIHGGINVTVPAGTSRASADQTAAAIADRLSRASRRNR